MGAKERYEDRLEDDGLRFRVWWLLAPIGGAGAVSAYMCSVMAFAGWSGAFGCLIALEAICALGSAAVMFLIFPEAAKERADEGARARREAAAELWLNWACEERLLEGAYPASSPEDGIRRRAFYRWAEARAEEIRKGGTV